MNIIRGATSSTAPRADGTNGVGILEEIEEASEEHELKRDTSTSGSLLNKVPNRDDQRNVAGSGGSYPSNPTGMVRSDSA